jgi:NAD+ synthase
MRMMYLYALAQELGYRVAGTGNRSERYIGWCTKWGDMACDFNPIAHLTCTEVIALGDYLELPSGLVHKTPSDGLTNRSDEENFGFTYAELDAYILRGEVKNPEIIQKIESMHKASKHKFAPTIIEYHDN